MSSSNYDKAKELWESFKNDALYKHRFFLKHPVLDMLSEIAKSLESSIIPGRIFYRARIIDDEAAKNEHMIARCYGKDATEEERLWYRNKANKFKGLSREGSYVPPNPRMVNEARSNPKFIRYLYMAESPTTAIYEVRPLLYNSVNVAGIKVLEELRIANIAVNINPDSAESLSVDEWLLSFIQVAFSSPTNNPDDYIPSQIIAEFFRYLGYDGIRYSSSLHKGGYNLTVYDVSKCEPVFSTDLRLEGMKIYLKPALGAENIDGRFEYIVDNVPMRIDRKTLHLVEVKV